MYEGDPGAWPRVVTGTLMRAFFILPGLGLAGIRGRNLIVGSALGSVGITAALFVLYGLKRAGAVKWAPQ